MSGAERRASALTGIVMAAGASTRMGRPKPLLPLGGRPVLRWVIDEALASRLDDVILVLGHGSREIRDALRLPAEARVRVVVNRAHRRGLSSSLRAGLRAAPPRAVAAAVLLGDQPMVGRELIDRVAGAFLAGDRPVARPVYARPGGRTRPGHPVFLARRIWPQVARLRGDAGVRDLLSTRPEWLLSVPVEGEPPDDLDTWEDYQRATARAGSLGGKGEPER